MRFTRKNKKKIVLCWGLFSHCGFVYCNYFKTFRMFFVSYSLSPSSPLHFYLCSFGLFFFFKRRKKAHSKLRSQEDRNNNAQQWCAIFCDCSHLFCSVLYCGIFFNKENSGLLTSNNCSVLLNLVNIGMKNSVCMGTKGNCCCLFPFKCILFFRYYWVVSEGFFLCSSWFHFPFYATLENSALYGLIKLLQSQKDFLCK